MGNWLIYGATGYTADLIIHKARLRGHAPILAGRNGPAIARLSAEKKLPASVFDLSSVDLAAAHLKGIDLVLNCAGPFSATAEPMIEACVKARCHYLDITGEISVLDGVHALDHALRTAGVSAIPGVGFDVVPTDCLAAMLKRRMPDATELTLAFKSVGGRMSPGTMKTMIEGLGAGGCVRKGGKLVGVPFASKARRIPFAGRESTGVLVPWGDVASAWYSTGIPNIEVYMAMPRVQGGAVRMVGKARPAFRVPGVQGFLKHQVGRFVKGPDAARRDAGRCELWGEVQNAAGTRLEMTMRTRDGYTFTADSAVRAVEKVLAGGVPSGALTPSLAFGTDFVKEVEGVTVTGVHLA